MANQDSETKSPSKRKDPKKGTWQQEEWFIIGKMERRDEFATHYENFNDVEI